MKTYKLLQFTCLAALLGLATGCADDVLVENAPQMGTASGQLTLQASVPGNGSRIQYQEGTEKMTMVWDSDDVLKVLSSKGDSVITDFTLTEGAGQSNASFTNASEVAYSDGEELYALYHNGLVDTQFDADGNLVLSLKEQDGTLNEDYQLMFGKTTYKTATGLQAVSLNPLVSILKLTIQTDKTLKQITLDSGDFRNKATLVLKNSPSNSSHTFQTGDLFYCYSDDDEEDADYDTVSVTGNFAPVNGEVTVYFYILPAYRYWVDWEGLENRYVDPSFTAVDVDGNIFENERGFGSRNLSTGIMYRLSTKLYQDVPFANEQTANGSYDYPYEIATAEQLYSFMMRIAKNRHNNEGRSYADCNYKLTADIELNNEYIWEPAILNYATFDGQGFTLSGNICMKDVWQTGLFREINGATIRDLNLDFSSLTFETDEHHDYFGTLVGSANSNSQIINCTNRTNVTGDFRCMAGLVAYSLNSTLTGCANTGNITATGYVDCLGGLVAIDEEESAINVSYSTGELSAGYSDMKVGGIIGHLRGKLQYAWSSCVFNPTSEDLSFNWGALAGAVYGGTLQNAYWHENVEASHGFINESGTTDGILETFSGDYPSAEQLDSLNTLITLDGYLYYFDERGKIALGSSTEGSEE